MRVLLTDGLQRKTLVATRSLGRAGYEPWVADDTQFSLARWSRHCHRALICPRPEGAAFQDWLRRTAAEVDLLLPMDDATTEAAIACRGDLAARALLPSAEQFRVGRDKLLTAELAERSDVPHPRTVAVDTATDVAQARQGIGGEVVLRPRFGSGGRGVRFLGVDDPATDGPVRAHIVQQRLPLGRKFDVGLLYGPTGEVRASFCQEELRWFPGEQGASTLQRSVRRDDLVVLSERLLKPIGWQGMVEVEWMLVGDEPVLLEINPRPWASLGLAVAAGVDFPLLWAELALGHDVRGPRDYDTQLACRWSLPADLLHLAAHPLRRLSLAAPAPLAGERVVDDVVDMRDPGPVAGFFVAVLGHLFDAPTWRQVMRW